MDVIFHIFCCALQVSSLVALEQSSTNAKWSEKYDLNGPQIEPETGGVREKGRRGRIGREEGRRGEEEEETIE